MSRLASIRAACSSTLSERLAVPILARVDQLEAVLRLGGFHVMLRGDREGRETGDDEQCRDPGSLSEEVEEGGEVDKAGDPPATARADTVGRRTGRVAHLAPPLG